MTTTDLDGRVAIVTGGGSGIGRATALALGRAGATVAVADLDGDAAEAVVAEAGGGLAVTIDVTDAGACADLVARVQRELGRLDVLHANAGVALVGQDGFSPDIEPAAWARVIAVNLSGIFHCIRPAIPAMAATGGGSIIATASSMSTVPLGGMDAYAASKAGVVGLVKSASVGAARLNVRINAIAPGYVDTPMNELIWGNDEVKEAFALGHATGLQTAEEIADIVVFLASDASRSLTGALLTCDRGWTSFKQPDLLRRLLG